GSGAEEMRPSACASNSPFPPSIVCTSFASSSSVNRAFITVIAAEYCNDVKIVSESFDLVLARGGFNDERMSAMAVADAIKPKPSCRSGRSVRRQCHEAPPVNAIQTKLLHTVRKTRVGN